MSQGKKVWPVAKQTREKSKIIDKSQGKIFLKTGENPGVGGYGFNRQRYKNV